MAGLWHFGAACLHRGEHRGKELGELLLRLGVVLDRLGELIGERLELLAARLRRAERLGALAPPLVHLHLQLGRPPPLAPQLLKVRRERRIRDGAAARRRRRRRRPWGVVDVDRAEQLAAEGAEQLLVPVEEICDAVEAAAHRRRPEGVRQPDPAGDDERLPDLRLGEHAHRRVVVPLRVEAAQPLVERVLDRVVEERALFRSAADAELAKTFDEVGGGVDGGRDGRWERRRRVRGLLRKIRCCWPQV